ncbi:MAG: phosphatidate cytidylyltransferase [Alkalinema sp. RU_4_3]|nr:phosphatidate cytidylyltransferase [Alkalinema sp. RU_4_3]
MPIDTLWLNVVIAALWLVLVGGLAFVVDRATPPGTEWTRKVLHIGTGNIILIAWWLNIPAWVGIGSAVMFTGVSIASYALPLLPSVNNIGRRSWGTCFYAISIGVLVAWFWPLQMPSLAALGILVMTWGDGLAGLIGKRFGKHRYQVMGMTKSWEGTATMGIVSFIVSLAMLWPGCANPFVASAIALTVALFATLLESFSKLGIDNLTVPIGSSALAYGLIRLFCLNLLP